MRRYLLPMLCSLLFLTMAARGEPSVLPGIDVLERDGFALVLDQRVGLVAHPASRTADLRHTADVLLAAGGVELVALFGPEHGVYGDAPAGEHVATAVDAQTGLPAHSLYGATRKPTAEMLAGLDVLVFDLQDIGVRSYTYASTLKRCLEACAEHGVKLLVLDRPNPLGGERVEGGLVEPGFESFISLIPTPYVHGLTFGELALMLNEEIGAELEVVRMSGWRRSMLWADTRLEWVATSPHVPRADSAAYLVMTGVAGELESVSVGVGYTLPFELFGAPGLDGHAMAERVSIDGLVLRPLVFQPYYSRFTGERVSGVQLHADVARVPSLLEVNLRLLEAAGSDAFFGDAERDGMFDKAMGSGRVRLALQSGEADAIDRLTSEWEADESAFGASRTRFLLYE